jgi:hypothetical protein
VKKDLEDLIVFIQFVLIIAMETESALEDNAIVEMDIKEKHVKFKNAPMIVLEMVFVETGNAFAIKVMKVLIVLEKF